jgi:hypothetical protein
VNVNHPLTKQKFAVQDSEDSWTRLPSVRSACEDSLYPFDREVVAAIRRDIDPLFIPLVRYTTYKSLSGAYETWPHFLWCRAIPVPIAEDKARKVSNVLWPVTPGSVNYGMDRWSNVLYFERALDGGRPGDSEFKPGRIYPLTWSFYRLVKDMYDKARRVSHEQEADQIEAAEIERKAKNDAHMSEWTFNKVKADARRWKGDPMVAVPSKQFGDAA